MAIWGKILGGAAGFAVGGPLGALVGAVAGHAFDRLRGRTASGDETDSLAKQTTFAIAVIVLGAKMAKADGHVTKDEVAAFREVFHIPPEEMKNVARIFNQARKDSRGFEPYAKQVARMFRDNPAVMEELLDGLFHIAKADKVVHPAELDYLAKIAEIFGFDEARFARIRAGHIGRDAADPFAILGVAPNASDDDIRSAYRKLIRENHPDKLIAEGLPQEFIDLANDKMATINAAYDDIRAQRGQG